MAASGNTPRLPGPRYISSFVQGLCRELSKVCSDRGSVFKHRVHLSHVEQTAARKAETCRRGILPSEVDEGIEGNSLTPELLFQEAC